MPRDNNATPQSSIPQYQNSNDAARRRRLENAAVLRGIHKAKLPDKMDAMVRRRVALRCVDENLPSTSRPRGPALTRSCMAKCSEPLVGVVVPDPVATAAVAAALRPEAIPAPVPASVAALTGLPVTATDYDARTRASHDLAVAQTRESNLLRLHAMCQRNPKLTNEGTHVEQPPCLRCAVRELPCSLERHGGVGATRCTACLRAREGYCLQALFALQRRAPGDGDQDCHRNIGSLRLASNIAGPERQYSYVDEDSRIEGNLCNRAGLPPQRFVYATVPIPTTTATTILPLLYGGDSTVTVYIRNTASESSLPSSLPDSERLAEMATELLEEGRKQASTCGPALPDWRPRVLEWRQVKAEQEAAWLRGCVDIELGVLGLDGALDGAGDSRPEPMTEAADESSPVWADYFAMRREEKELDDLQPYEYTPQRALTALGAGTEKGHDDGR